MALKVIGAGSAAPARFRSSSRSSTSASAVLPHVGGVRRRAAQRAAVARRGAGQPTGTRSSTGSCSTTDYPACTYWRELADHYPEAKVVLTVRDPDSWFDSVSETIFSEACRDR
jgi:hypothetical protein